MHQTQWSPERPLPPPVSLASPSHHEKPAEVTCTSRGNPGFPASTRESPRETSFNTSRGQIPLPWLGSNEALALATRMETRLPWRPTRGSLTSPSVRHAERMLQGETGGDHLAEDRPDRVGGKRPRVLRSQARVDLFLALGDVEIQVLLRLLAADLDHQLRPAVQEPQDLGVDLVNCLAQVGDSQRPPLPVHPCGMIAGRSRAIKVFLGPDLPDGRAGPIPPSSGAPAPPIPPSLRKLRRVARAHTGRAALPARAGATAPGGAAPAQAARGPPG